MSSDSTESLGNNADSLEATELGILAGEGERSLRLLANILAGDKRDLNSISASEFLATLQFPENVRRFIAHLVSVSENKYEEGDMEYESGDAARVRTIMNVAGILNTLRERALANIPPEDVPPSPISDSVGQVANLYMELNDPGNMPPYELAQQVHGDKKLDIPN